MPTWLAFGCAVGLAVLIGGIVEAVAFPPEPGATDDAPPLVVLFLAVAASIGALLAGPLIVPFRALIMGPRFPFLRRGSAVMAALAFVHAAFLSGPWLARLGFAALEQVPIALSALIFIGLGRLFGAFDPAELIVQEPGSMAEVFD